MGLDMCIFKTNKDEKAKSKLLFDIQRAVKGEEEKSVYVGGNYLRIRYVWEDHTNNVEKLNPVAKWRKANHIHEWFSVNVLGNEEGKPVQHFGCVSKHHLLQLLQMCEETLAHNIIAIDDDGEHYLMDVEYCQNMFPPNKTVPYSGSKEYGEWFIEDLKHTIAVAKKLLATTNFPKSKLYYFAYY